LGHDLVRVSALDPAPRGYAFEKFLKELFGVYGMSARESNGVAGRPRFIEATAPPALENGVKREIRLHGIKDIGAGVNAGLHGVASQEIVAKAVNRRAGQL
jgi:hypothetical protein